jgi:hypothetical protein
MAGMFLIGAGVTIPPEIAPKFILAVALAVYLLAALGEKK